VIIFTGERGSGKSWLLAHLQTELSKLSPLSTYQFDLGKCKDLSVHPAALSVLDDIQQALCPSSVTGVDLSNVSRNLVQGIRQLLLKKVLVVLADHVYESDWKLLAVLEDYLLGPLAVEPCVLIVMTGRGRAYSWKTPELRLKAEFVDLEPFPDVAITTEQLKRQQKKAAARAPQIHELSGGNPLANFLLAAHEDPAAALDQVIAGMLETVSVEHRQIVREYLEALCVLRSFDEERIPALLAVYYDNDTYRGWSYAQSRRVREELVKWAFAHWDADQGGYVLDGPTRKLLEQYLKAQDPPERWKRLQQAASELYKKWAQDYPRAKDRWQQEVQYHVRQLQAVRAPAAAAL